MVSHLVNALWNWSPWSVEEGSWESGFCTTEVKVKNLGATLQQHPKKRSSPRTGSHTLTPLRLLFWANLTAGACGQLTDPFPASMELSSLDGSNGFIINGEAMGDNSGNSLSSAGDVNGDGIDDLVIGAFRASPLVRSLAGKSYVVFGSRKLVSGGILELSSLDGIVGFALNGDQTNDQSGCAVSSVGDVNGDGIGDMLIGAFAADPSSGRSKAGKTYVVFGKSSLGAGGAIELSSLDGTTGFVLNGDRANDESGFSVSGAGDVNGDGVADLLIGAYLADPNGRSEAGKSYVVFGKSNLGQGGTLELSGLDGTTGFVINGAINRDQSGISVSGAGDVNGDGIADLLIGADKADPSSRTRAGKAYVVFGNRALGSSGTLELLFLDGTAGIVLNGADDHDHTGTSVSYAGDVNGDGIADLLVGAYWADPGGRSNAGKTYVVFGKTGLGGSLDFGALDGKIGFTIRGEQEEDESGFSIAGAGDFNGDGMDDLVIGAHLANPTSNRANAGKTYVVFGKRDLGSSGSLQLQSLDETTGLIINGDQGNDQSGISVAGSGDVNGDGVADIIIGAHQATPAGGRSAAGKIYVVFGRKPATSSTSTRFKTMSQPASSPTSSLSAQTTGLPITTSTSPPTPSFSAQTTDPTKMISTSTRPTATFALLPNERMSHSLSDSPTLPLATLGASTAPPTSEPSVATDPAPVSLDLPLGIAGGVCAVVSSVTAAALALRCRKKNTRDDNALSMQEVPLSSDCSSLQSDVVPASTTSYGSADNLAPVRKGAYCQWDEVSFEPSPDHQLQGHYQDAQVVRQRQSIQPKAADVTSYTSMPSSQDYHQFKP